MKKGEERSHSKIAAGFADVHNHMFAEYAFGGAWLHGHVVGPIEQALSSCEEEADHAQVTLPFISSFIGRIIGSTGDTGNHSDKHSGFPDFKGWPRWDTIAHQQMWEGHLLEAHQHGLSLLVVSMMNFEPLCNLMPKNNKKFEDCSDTFAVNKQLAVVHDFEKTHSWFKIVLTPLEARQAIQDGKLAVILSIEASHIFGDGDWRKEFEDAYSQGVRTLQLGHQMNNRFTGVAMHNPIFRIISFINDFLNMKHWWNIFRPGLFGFRYEDDPITRVRKNRKGLTQDGRDLLQEMMKRGMMIDLAHESEKAVREIQAMTKARSNYPVYLSHGHFRPAMNDGKFSVWEKASEDWIVDYIRDSGGVFGLRTGPEKTMSVPGTAAPNDCQGSSKSFAQSYQYGNSRGVAIAFGSDLNGFIQQIRPRFGNVNETCGAEENKSERERQQKAQTKPLNRSFDQTGFGDMSKLPDVLAELKNFGVNTENLESSTENFILMWEKAIRATRVSDYFLR
ncbi:MAG: membrane dipeptidase [Bdellovibrionales bacterium]|nr:membrane dipeptidase [Oligoflexia bacterium]